jgi:hypothetical protein
MYIYGILQGTSDDASDDDKYIYCTYICIYMYNIYTEFGYIYIMYTYILFNSSRALLMMLPMMIKWKWKEACQNCCTL